MKNPTKYQYVAEIRGESPLSRVSSIWTNGRRILAAARRYKRAHPETKVFIYRMPHSQRWGWDLPTFRVCSELWHTL